MAYAEKRGKGPRPWRVKYKRPDGSEGSEAGFETKAAALAWGRNQESRIREGRWTDKRASKITVNEWIDRWLVLQDVGVSTQDLRSYLLRRFVRPAWGSRTLGSLTTEEITRWENGLPSTAGVSRRTAQLARGILCTLLGDAATMRPPLIPYNPALRARNRGRRTGRRIQQTPQRTWATPLEILLIAERAALLSGSADDFTFILTIAYTGMRWAEVIGLEREHLRLSLINVEWQLEEVNGAFHRLPPKDDSYRSTGWEPKVPVDLPPFLADLLSRHVTAHPRKRCGCAESHGAAASTSSSALRAATTGAATSRAAYSTPRWRAAFSPSKAGRANW